MDSFFDVALASGNHAESDASFRAPHGCSFGAIEVSAGADHNLVRSFRSICDQNKIQLIKVHHLRHTVGSLLKDLGVPARDAQTILGYTRISATLEIYTDTGEQARRDALTRLDGLLDHAQD